ncbi:hypothetical protein [Leptospirillum ferriphilum]|nr:hypothetical protein [Leptospirillum ferriphilum]
MKNESHLCYMLLLSCNILVPVASGHRMVEPSSSQFRRQEPTGRPD